MGGFVLPLSMKNKAFWLYSYRACIKGSKIKNLKFDLSLDQFIKISSQNCYYCNAAPVERFDLYTQRIKETMVFDYQIEEDVFESYIGKSNGIDRLDNTVGYVIGNCKACCWKCNRLKAAASEKDFLTQVQKIYNYSIKDRHNGKILPTK